MKLPGQIEVKNGNANSGTHKWMKRMSHRAWRRFKQELKPLYNRYSGWEM